jgi:crotonobetainyl-CoA:carnitine CoA-transferase CaiB-like acyl-CoA transferase
MVDAPSAAAPTALAGMRVVEIAAGLAVAYTGKLLAQYGAEVIRIEPPGGDEIRRAGPFKEDRPDLDAGGLHAFMNSGKRSVVLDLTVEDGARAAARLVAGSALLLTSWKTPTAAALPLAQPERMRERFPETTYVSISEFGFTGPSRDHAADSHIIEGQAGMSYVTGHPDREPLSSGAEVADYFAACQAVIAALASVLDRGAGAMHHFVDVSILESLTLSDDHNLAVYAGTGGVRRRFYSRVLVAYPTDVFAVKDGHIAFVPTGRNFAEPISKLIDRPELATDPLFLNPQERVVRWREFDAIVKPWLEAHTVEEVLRKAEELHQAFGNVNNARDLVEDRHLRERGFWIELDGQLQMAPAARFSETPARVGPAPRLGADGAALLGEEAR